MTLFVLQGDLSWF